MNTCTRRRWAWCLALLAPLAGCMPSYYIRLQPSGTVSRWEEGHPLVAAAADSVETLVGVASTVNQWVDFDVTVRNTSSRPVLVAPEQFYALVDFPATKTTAALHVRVPAEDPEQALQTLSQQADYHARKSTAVPLGEVLSSLNNLTQDLSSNKRKETTEQYNARKAAYQAEQNSYEQDRTSHAVQAASLRDDVRRLEDTRLRKTTLSPGYALRGRVRFPAWFHTATQVRVMLPVNGRELSADFTQTAYRADGSQPALAPTAALPAGAVASPPAPPAPATVRP